MKACGGVCVQIHVFLNSALVGGKWSASSSGHFILKKERYLLYRRLGGPQSRSKRHAEMKILILPGLKLRPLGCSSSSHSLHRLRSTLNVFPYINHTANSSEEVNNCSYQSETQDQMLTKLFNCLSQ
jgi:hypothetical protein